MSFLISDAHAQAAGGAAADPFSPLIMMVVFFAIFYFIAIRPQMKRAKEHRAMLEAIAKGDEVVTSGGILGRVVDISDAFISVEIADNLQIKVQKHAISAVLPKGTIKAA
jgi:preprotein translocase subunit YajC